VTELHAPSFRKHSAKGWDPTNLEKSPIWVPQVSGSPVTGLRHWDEDSISRPRISLCRQSHRTGILIPILSLFSFLLTACRPHDFPQYPPNYREYAYVTNGASGTVTVLDIVDVRVDREIPVGPNPVAVIASPTRNEVYVVNSGSPYGQGSISVINAENNTVAAVIQVRRQPVSIDLDPSGARAYVANSGSNSVSIVDLKSRREIAVIGVGDQPSAVRVAPDGQSLVVANRRGNSVTIIDPDSRRIRAVFEGCPGASAIVILPDSTKAFAACSAGHQVMAIVLAHSQANPAQPDRLEALMDVGRAPVYLALKPDGGEFFSLNSLSDSISEVSTPTNDVGGATLMGDDPINGLVSRDNSLLYVCNFRSQEVTLYAIDEGHRVGGPGGHIHVGDGPSAMAFSAAGHLLFVVDTRSGDVSVVRTSTHSLFTLLPTNRAPNAIADKAFKIP
jgi:YVTN family beta-propeller protein